MKAILLTFILSSSLAYAKQDAAPPPLKPCPRCDEMLELINNNNLEKEQKYVVDFDLVNGSELEAQEAFAYTLVALHFIPLDLNGEDSSTPYYDIYNRHVDVMKAARDRLLPKDQKILRDSYNATKKLFQHGNG